jgi:predicted PurR-regulated permease PerM
MNDDDSRATMLHRISRWSLRYLLILAAIYVTFVALGIVQVVVLPIILALFPTSVLSPLVGALKRRGWSPLAATWGALLAMIPVLALITAIAVPSIAGSADELGQDLEEAVDSVSTWLSEGPLELSDTEIQQYIDSAYESLQRNASTITGGVLGGATVAIEVVTGAVLILLVTFFYLKDGERAVAGFLARTHNRERMSQALEAGWRTLSSYVRGLAIVGIVDATLIGIGLAIVGTPLVAVLMMLVFIGSFFPVVGAFVSGLVAVAVTLVNGGLVNALIILAVVIGVQQIEGNVIYPIVFRRALSLHPLVILLALSIGGVAFGLVGAFLAVPITAVAVAVHQAVSDDAEGSYVALLTDRPYLAAPETSTSDTELEGEPEADE